MNACFDDLSESPALAISSRSRRLCLPFLFFYVLELLQLLSSGAGTLSSRQKKKINSVHSLKDFLSNYVTSNHVADTITILYELKVHKQKLGHEA